MHNVKITTQVTVNFHTFCTKIAHNRPPYEPTRLDSELGP
jgi:hypothetical protein